MPSAFISRLAALLLVAGGLFVAYLAYQEAVVPLMKGGSAIRMEPMEEAEPAVDAEGQPAGPAVLQTPGLSEEEKSLPTPEPEASAPVDPSMNPAVDANGTAPAAAAVTMPSAPALSGAASGSSVPGAPGAVMGAPAQPAAAPVEVTAPKLELSVRRPDDVRVRITSGQTQDAAPSAPMVAPVAPPTPAPAPAQPAAR